MQHQRYHLNRPADRSRCAAAQGGLGLIFDKVKELQQEMKS